MKPADEKTRREQRAVWKRRRTKEKEPATWKKKEEEKEGCMQCDRALFHTSCAEGEERERKGRREPAAFPLLLTSSDLLFPFYSFLPSAVQALGKKEIASLPSFSSSSVCKLTTADSRPSSRG